jgi:hypothetical protein
MENVLTGYKQESIWNRRGVLAFVLAPLVPVFFYSLSSGPLFLSNMLFGGAIAYAYVLLLGLPLVAWFNLRRKISLLGSAIGGAFIGMLPLLVVMGFALSRSRTPMDSNATFSALSSLRLFGTMGLIAGVAWWFIACYKRNPVTV